MHQTRLRRLLAQGSMAALAATTIALSACGSSSGGATGNKDFIIASELPVSGGDAGNGIPTQHGVELAVSQANLGSGYTLSWLGTDDVLTSAGKHDAATGAANMAKLVANSKVVGVVGPFNSGVAAAEIPIAQSATLTMISPSNTNPGLTLQQYSDANGFNYAILHPAGKPNAYFRIPGNDVVQGKIDADIALAPAPGPGAKSVYVIDDNEPYGKGLADQFVAEFTAKGGKTVGTRQSISATQSSTFASLATSIIAAKPDVVFYGGTTTGGGGALKQAVAAAGGQTILWEGGDGIANDPDWLKEAGAAASGTFGTVAAADITSLGATNPVAAKFITDYTAKFGAAPGNYSAAAFDGAMIEINAIKSLITANKPVTRANVRDAVASINYTGVTGNIAFDQYGDNSGARVFSIWLAKPDTSGAPAWVFQQNVSG